MLIALITILLLGGSSAGLLDYIADTRDNVKIVMPRGDAQRAALDTLKLMKKGTTARNKQVKRASKDLGKAFQDHGVAAGEIDAIWAGYFATVNQYDHDMLDLRFELKEHISREEWEAIFSGD